MGGGVLSNIFERLTKRYGNEAFNILNDYGDDIASKGMDSVLGRHVSGKKIPEPLLVGHQLTQDALEHADQQLGGKLINPSIQATNGKSAASEYGEIYLLGNKGMFNPNNPGVNPYPRDIFSPRFPRTVTKEGSSMPIIETTGKPAYPQYLSEAMNAQPLRNAGNGTYNGAIAAERAPRLSGVAGALDAQDVLSPHWYGEAVANETARNNIAWDLRKNQTVIDNLTPTDGGYLEPEINRYIGGMIRGEDPLNLGADKELAAKIEDLSNRLNSATTGYMESKITRPVDLGEFTGALVPDYRLGADAANTQKIIETLNKYGITDISTYSAFDRYGTVMSPTKFQWPTGEFIENRLKTKNLAERFKTPYLMGTAGAIPTAGVLGSLFSGGQQEQA